MIQEVDSTSYDGSMRTDLTAQATEKHTKFLNSVGTCGGASDV